MKIILTGIAAAAGAVVVTVLVYTMKDSFRPGSFGADTAFLKKHTELIILEKQQSRLALAPAWQGRVMTSSAGGDDADSYGFLNREVIETGVLQGEAARGKLQKHIHVFGGEERFWLGPEGGQFGIFFKPGAPFEFDDWKTPPPIDTEAWQVKSRSDSRVVFEHRARFTNHSGTVFDTHIERAVSLLDESEIKNLLGVDPGAGVNSVAYRTDNRLTNTGQDDWKREKGLLSIWLLGMFKPSATTVVVIPFKEGSDAELGPRVNDAYFGRVPADYLKVENSLLFFKGDGTRRGKIGVSPQRSLGIAGSYDAAASLLTLVLFDQPAVYTGYVNSMWEHQQKPYNGDAINSYNDGSPGEGVEPLGPFYELETSSMAAELKAGGSLRHVQTTVHLQGDRAGLEKIARKFFKTSLTKIEQAFQ